MIPVVATQSPGGSIGSLLFLMMPMILIFYFLLWRPQKKRQQHLQEMIAGLKKGDQVVTNGGIHGRVVRSEDATITLAVAQGVEIRFSKGSITGVVEEGGS